VAQSGGSSWGASFGEQGAEVPALARWGVPQSPKIDPRCGSASLPLAAKNLAACVAGGNSRSRSIIV